MSPKPAVLLTDGGDRSVLAACRGLAAAGYRVGTVAAARRAAAFWSRSCSDRIVLRDPRSDPRGYVEALAGELARRRFDVLLPGSEASLLPISEHRELIPPAVALGLPPHETLLRALDKLTLPSEAAAAGLAPPASIVCSTLTEARTAGGKLGFPLVAKPQRSFSPTGRGLRQYPAEVVANPACLPRAVGEMGLPISLQQYVANASVVSVAGVRAASRILGLTVVRYARTWPPLAGSASMAVTIDAPPGLVERVEVLLAQIGWSGVFELELLDLGGGRFGAIDLNPRLFGWITLAIEAGANLPALWCDHLLGRRSVTGAAARPGVRYRWQDADARHFLWQLRRGRLRQARAVLRPVRGAVHPYLRLDDPAPAFARAVELVLAAGQKRQAKAQGAVLVALPQSREEDHVPDRVATG